ncbi:uncharacterized protein BX663DRAFT_513046 [Cokeromyces recurvatus]|uniref:uncharacterized protein n=1 Tax=Cokeromyces recurvatus TaxID=90255 RepID=UPI002220D2E6|nr:uncharacterized protein BX663DRAFT_513046 [Cokeromyces recurvatus]KAI7901957.1 hypothetical protein BX663DRAFT_513046 [Cokeromyces recurvatus]
MSWDNLSIEITLTIFSHFAPYSSEIDQLQLTCKRWYHCAQKIRYSNVTLCKKTEADSFIQLLRSSPGRPGQMVKSLNLMNLLEGVVWDPEDYMTTFAKICPKIENIRICKPQKEFWMKLVHDRYFDRWQALKSTNLPSTEEDLMHYNCTMSVFRTTIVRLLLCDSLQRITEGERRCTKEFKLLAHRLKEFVHLQELSIQIHTDKQLYQLDDYIQNCSNTLEKLEIIAYQPMDIPSPSQNHPVSLLEIEQRPTIKCLAVNMSVYNNDSLGYLMYKFPCLEQLSLNEKVDRDAVNLLARAKFSLTSELMANFFQYISQIPSINIQYIATDNIIDICRYYKESIKNTLSLRLRYLEPVHVRKQISAGLIHIKSMNTTTTTTTSSSSSSSEPKNYLRNKLIQLEMYFGTYTELLYLPHTHAIQILGDTVEEINFGIEVRNNNNSNDNVSHNNNISSYFTTGIGYSMDTLFKHCPRLKRLSLENLDLLNCNPSIQINKTVEKLAIVKSNVNEDFLFELSIRLPNLKHFILEHTTIKDKNKKSTMMITMPYTSFDTFYWIKKTSDDYKKMYIKISSVDNERYFIAYFNETNLIEESNADAYNHKHEPDSTSLHIRCRTLLRFYTNKASCI